jgi:hypothetical protein
MRVLGRLVNGYSPHVDAQLNVPVSMLMCGTTTDACPE